MILRRVRRPLLLLLLAAAACSEPVADSTSSDSAVDAAIASGLRWLARTQEADGSYSLHKHNPHHGRPGIAGFYEEDHWLDVAGTALVLLAQLECGVPLEEDGQPTSAGRALAWILKHRLPDGRFGYDEAEADRYFVDELGQRSLTHPHGPGYKALTIHQFNHAIATAAVAEVYRRTRDDDLRGPLRAALKVITKHEHAEYVWPSIYDPYGDVAVVPYVVQAAVAARAAGLEAESAPLLDPLIDFLDRVTDADTGRTVMLRDDAPWDFDGIDSAALNARCRRMAGQEPRAERLRPVLLLVASTRLSWDAFTPQKGDHGTQRSVGPCVNYELWHAGAYSLHGIDLASARAFRSTLRGLLLTHQARHLTLAGSWEPDGIWSRVGGRVYSTAMALRTLAVLRD